MCGWADSRDVVSAAAEVARKLRREKPNGRGNGPPRKLDRVHLRVAPGDVQGILKL
jgi:hypothetical protein